MHEQIWPPRAVAVRLKPRFESEVIYAQCSVVFLVVQLELRPPLDTKFDAGGVLYMQCVCVEYPCCQSVCAPGVPQLGLCLLGPGVTTTTIMERQLTLGFPLQ